jgi:hypothetical protein
MTAEKFHIPVQREDWLKEAIPSVIQQLELLRDDRWPRVLRGYSIVTICLRLMRCVWQSDVATLHAMQQHVIGNLEFSKICDDHFTQWPYGCQDQKCVLCMDIREAAGEGGERQK